MCIKQSYGCKDQVDKAKVQDLGRLNQQIYEINWNEMIQQDWLDDCGNCLIYIFLMFSITSPNFIRERLMRVVLK